jgi:transposase
VEKLIRVGMDTSKSVFVLHGVDAAEKVVLRKKLRRQQVIEFFGKLKPTKIGLEACGAAHYWARELEALAHEVVLLPPQYVKPYVKRGKNDAADAEAICEAMSRPTMRFVPVKTAEQQAALMLAGTRDRLIRMRTQLTNAIRGYAAEFGLTAAKGLDKIEPLLARLTAATELPKLAKELFAAHAREYAQLKVEIQKIEAKLMAWHKHNELSRRLVEVPAIGPIGASLVVMKVPDPHAFRSGRDFSAWIGLRMSAGSARSRRS